MVKSQHANKPHSADSGSELQYDIQDDTQTDAIKEAIQQFKIEKGRRPRILVSNIGTNHQAKVFAASCGSWGFDVDIGPDIQTPEQAAKMAVENDVHIICHVSCADRKTAIEMIEALRKAKGNEILVTILGAVSPEGIERYCRTKASGDVLVDETTTLTVLRLLEQITGK